MIKMPINSENSKKCSKGKKWQKIPKNVKKCYKFKKKLNLITKIFKKNAGNDKKCQNILKKSEKCYECQNDKNSKKYEKCQEKLKLWSLQKFCWKKFNL
jgi:hypothetical protein